jgi:hypothetical protein
MASPVTACRVDGRERSAARCPSQVLDLLAPLGAKAPANGGPLGCLHDRSSLEAGASRARRHGTPVWVAAMSPPTGPGRKRHFDLFRPASTRIPGSAPKRPNYGQNDVSAAWQNRRSKGFFPYARGPGQGDFTRDFPRDYLRENRPTTRPHTRRPLRSLRPTRPQPGSTTVSVSGWPSTVTWSI